MPLLWGVVLIGFVWCFPLELRAQETTAPVPDEVWQSSVQGRLDGLGGSIRNEVDDLLDRGGIEVAEVLIDAIEDISLLKTDLGSDAQVDFSVHRRIVDNQDPKNSWTVVDEFRVGMNAQLVNRAIRETANGSIRFTAGLVPVFRFQTIRQVWSGLGINSGKLPTWEELPSLETAREELQKMARSMEMPDQNTSLEDLKLAAHELQQEEAAANEPAAGEQQALKWLYLDSSGKASTTEGVDAEFQAAFSSFWSLFKTPYRVLRAAFNAERVMQMETGEIFSFIAYGSLPVGIQGATPLGTSGQLFARYQHFVSGFWRFSVLKRSGSEVLVKVSREVAPELLKNRLLTLGAQWNVFDGFTVLGWNPFDGAESGYTIDWRRSRLDTKSISYTFDLDHPEACEALGSLMRGNLRKSNELSSDWDLEPGKPQRLDTGVFKEAIRYTQEEHEFFRTDARLGFLFKNQNTSQFRSVDATLIFPNGRKRFFEARAINERDFRTLIFFRKKRRYEFRLAVDLDVLGGKRMTEDPVTLSVEAAFRTSNDRYSGLRSKALEAEDAVGKPGIFPRIPRNYLGGVGRSRFYYRLMFNTAQLDRLVHMDESEMCGHFEMAYLGVRNGRWCQQATRAIDVGLRTVFVAPLTFVVDTLGFDSNEGYKGAHFQSTWDRWRKLKYEFDPKKKLNRLAKLFQTTHFSYEMIRWMRAALEDQEVPYIASGYNQTFGRIYEQGIGQMNPINLSTEVQLRSDRLFNFDDPFIGTQRNYSDDGSVVQSAKVEFAEDGKLFLLLELNQRIQLDPQQPQGLYVQLSERTPWVSFPLLRRVPQYRQRGQLLVYQKELLSAGENRIELKANDSSRPEFELLQEFQPGKEYRFRLSISRDHGYRWGPTTDRTFEVPESWSPIAQGTTLPDEQK